MSYFKSKGVILKKTKHKEKEFLYSIFSYDFWRIDVLKKIASKEKTLYIWYDINFEVHSKKNSSISRIANIKILHEFDTNNRDFQTINKYLTLLYTVYSKTEKNTAIYEIYTLLNQLHKTSINSDKILLARLKLKNIFWELVDNHTDPTAQKILTFIQKNSCKDVLRLTGIWDDISKQLEQLLD